MYEGSKVDLSWDNKWSSEVREYYDRYIFEMSIPFKTIRYKKGITRWGINFSRLDLKTTGPLRDWSRVTRDGGVLVFVDRGQAPEASRRALCGGLTEIQQRHAGRTIVTSGLVTHL